MKVIIAAIFMFIGLFVFLIGTLGILRFPDVFSRAHAAAKCDTLGFLLCLISLIIYAGFKPIVFKLLVILIFLWVTNPTATHLIAKAEYKRRKNNNGLEGYNNENV